VRALGIEEEEIDTSTTLYSLIPSGLINLAQAKLCLNLRVKEKEVKLNNIGCDRMTNITFNSTSMALQLLWALAAFSDPESIHSP
jgi:hypothetical protein